MNTILDRIAARNVGETEFLQAVKEVYESIQPVLEQDPKYNSFKIFERLAEPERVISFRVSWIDDKGEIQVNRGYRIQVNSAIGPYKGGLRFHPSVNQSILKFLGFEQVFKNALTGIPLGGGKGGSDFDPKGKSDAEVMRFCQNFMLELSRHIGHRVDVPAGDIGVGGREIGYLFGAYKKIQNEFTGILTGKGVNWGGSLVRPEATGYGLVYFAKNMLETAGDTFKGKKCLVSGSGNVAQYTVEKILALEGIAHTASDSSGYVFDKDGFDTEKLEFLKDLKNKRRGRIKEYADKFSSATFYPKDDTSEANPLWDHPADCAFPCATQNEIQVVDVNNLIKNGVKLLGEGANMPCTNEAIEIVLAKGLLYSPGKASNAGGVATSGLEMAQNYNGIKWTAEEVDHKLQGIMKDIHDTCLFYSNKYGLGNNYQAGANIAGFVKVADSMIDQGVI